MKWMRSFFKRLTDFLGKRKRDTEFAAELESHLRLHIEDNLRAGMTPEAARRDALMKLGGVEQTKENYCDRRGLPFIESRPHAAQVTHIHGGRSGYLGPGYRRKHCDLHAD